MQLNMLAIVLFFLALLPHLSLAYGNTTVALISFPPCSAACAQLYLPIANCQASDLSHCLCLNETLQYQIGVCIEKSCDTADQITTKLITQSQICNGVPKPWIGQVMIDASIAIAFVTFPTVVLRFIARIFLTKRLWRDDWVILFVTILMVFNTAAPIYLSYHGIGSHFYDVSPRDAPTLFTIYWVASIVYVLVQSLPKFSILFLYIRIITGRRFRTLVYIFMAWQGAHTIAFVLAVAFQCIPVSSIWNPLVHGHCLDIRALTIAGAAVSIFEDIAIILLPQWEVWHLKMSTKKKISVAVVFGLGSLSCIASMVRLKYLLGYGGIDQTWNSVPVIISSQVESYLAVICACLPALVPLFKAVIAYMAGLFHRRAAVSPANQNYELDEYTAHVETRIAANHPITKKRLSIRKKVETERFEGKKDEIKVEFTQHIESKSIPGDKRASVAGSNLGW